MSSIARIIDANFNRAREALRTLEDIARFHLNNEALVQGAKDLRHRLTGAIASLSPAMDSLERLAARDTEADVGVALFNAGEFYRPGLREVAHAAVGRLSEALRSLEEAVKCVSPEAAASIEAIRYAAYTLEKRIVLSMGTGRARQWRLCVLITESLCKHLPWEMVARAAVAGGADCLQLREKTPDDGELLARAKLMTRIAHEGGAAAIINDRPDIALLSGADGVHLGQTDLGVEDARKIAGARLLVGVSTENLEQARRAWADGADYCGVGPMFATETKNKPRLAGPEYLRQYVSEPGGGRGTRPHLAIGGITPDNVAMLVAAGSRGVAVSSCICGAVDPGAVCTKLLAGMPGTAGGVFEREGQPL